MRNVLYSKVISIFISLYEEITHFFFWWYICGDIINSVKGFPSWTKITCWMIQMTLLISAIIVKPSFINFLIFMNWSLISIDITLSSSIIITNLIFECFFFLHDWNLCVDSNDSFEQCYNHKFHTWMACFPHEWRSCVDSNYPFEQCCNHKLHIWRASFLHECQSCVD